MPVHRSMSAIGFKLWMSMVTHSLDKSSQHHVSNSIWVLGDSQAGCKFTGACQHFELWISMVTYSLDSSSQEHVSNWIWVLNAHGDSLPGCKFTGACQQLNISSECPWWPTAWMQVHSNMSEIEFDLWMSMVTHKLEASSHDYVSNWILALNVHSDSLPGYKFTGACQALDLSSECPWWLTP